MRVAGWFLFMLAIGFIVLGIQEGITWLLLIGAGLAPLGLSLTSAKAKKHKK